MNTRMLKYEIRVQPMSSVLTWHVGAVVRCVGVQRAGVVCLWAQTPMGDQHEQREFVTVGTGDEVLDSWTYVGTAFDGEFVLHVYEVQP